MRQKTWTNMTVAAATVNSYWCVLKQKVPDARIHFPPFVRTNFTLMSVFNDDIDKHMFALHDWAPAARMRHEERIYACWCRYWRHLMCTVEFVFRQETQLNQGCTGSPLIQCKECDCYMKLTPIHEASAKVRCKPCNVRFASPRSTNQTPQSHTHYNLIRQMVGLKTYPRTSTTDTHANQLTQIFRRRKINKTLLAFVACQRFGARGNYLGQVLTRYIRLLDY